MTDWDSRWLAVAAVYRSFSKDPSTKVGALTVRDNRPLSQGWNGFPRGYEDDPDELNDREVKYALTVHAEMNAVLNAAYNGIALEGSTLYVDGLPVCSDCAKCVVQAGIVRVVMRLNLLETPTSGRWHESFKKTAALFDEVGVEYGIRT